MTSNKEFFAKQKQVDEWLTQEVVAAGPGYFILDYEGPDSYSADIKVAEENWNTYEFISWVFGEQTVEYDVSSYLVEQCGINIPLDQDLLKNGFNRTSQLIFTLKDGSKLRLEAKSFKYEEGKLVWWEKENLNENDSWEWPVRIYVTLPNKETIVSYPDYQMGGWDWDFLYPPANQSINYQTLKI